MSNSSTIFEPIKIMPLEPYQLVGEIELTKKDRIIIDYFLENGNMPTHECGIARGVTIENKSGRKLRTITKKHAGDRCRYLEKVGILKHVSKKPLRGAGYRTPHYFLSDDIEAFQLLVDIYLKQENPIRMLIFMQSKYLDEAINTNISTLLVRWLIPDKQYEFQNELFFLLLHERLQRMSTESDAESEKEKNLSKYKAHDRSENVEAINRLLNALNTMDRKGAESDILLFFEQVNVFTDQQKSTYLNIVKLSPTALHMLVFLPFPKLLEQYVELGLIDILVSNYMEPQPNVKQKQVWTDLNRIIQGILFHSMTVDLMRYPFLIVPKRKRVILGSILNPDK